MAHRVSATVCAGLLLLASAPAFAGEQDDPSKGAAADSKSAARITLGSAVGEPGTTVVVPVYFAPPERVTIGRVKLQVQFVSRNLKFARAEKGIVAETSDFEIESAVREEKNEQGLENSALSLEVNAAAKDAAIPSGLLAYLNFQILPEANAAEITLRVKAETLESGASQAKEARAADSRVTVLASGTKPLISCFFFSH